MSTAPRSGITNDSNRADGPGHSVRLLGQVITLSLKAMEVVEGLPLLKM